MTLAARPARSNNDRPYTLEITMSDLALRLSVLLSDGYICKACGVEIDGQTIGQPRHCDSCQSVQNTDGAVEQEASDA